MKPLTAGILLCTLTLTGCTGQPDSAASYVRGLPTLSESTKPILRLIEENLEEQLEQENEAASSIQLEPEQDPNQEAETKVPARSDSDLDSDSNAEQEPPTNESYKPQYVVESVLENVIETVLDPARYASDMAASESNVNPSGSSSNDSSSEAGSASTSRPLLEEAEASSRIVNTLRAGSYAITLTDDQLTVGDNKEHEYFIFEVAEAETTEPVAGQVGANQGTRTKGNHVNTASTNTDTVIGYVAVNRVTGELYYYLGDGVLEDYSSFPQYDADAAWACRWVGTYQGPVNMTLEVLQGTSESFTYRFSDGTTGQAQLSGNTAKSNDPTINFLFADDTITVISEKLVGNYQRVQPDNENAEDAG